MGGLCFFVLFEACLYFFVNIIQDFNIRWLVYKYEILELSLKFYNGYLTIITYCIFYLNQFNLLYSQLIINNKIKNKKMILQDFHTNQAKHTIMINHRIYYKKIKALVNDRKFDQIDFKQVNKEKQMVISHLNNYQHQDMEEDIEQLSFYQERYLALCRYLAQIRQNGGADVNKTNKIVNIFQQTLQTEKQQEQQQDMHKFRKINTIQFEQKLQKSGLGTKKQKIEKNQKRNDLLSPIQEFFQKKQKQTKAVGFKDLLQKRNNISASSRALSRKPRTPAHDVQVKKLLQQNKRLHLQLQKRSKQDVQLNQYQKNVLRQQKQRCMKRIQQLQQQVQELARNNFKLQQIQRQRSRRVTISSFNNQNSLQSKNQLLPYYIKTRHNNLELITEKNKIQKIQNAQNQLLNLVSNIPPIEKKQQYSFDDSININQLKSRPIDNLILEGLLAEDDQKPRVQDYSRSRDSKSPRRKIFSPNHLSVSSNNRQDKQDIPQVQRRLKNNKYRSNQTIDNGSRFQSFSMANTAYNNSSLFLNASKNQVNIDSVTSTRNKVSFFKNSLIIFKDDNFQIAFKRSNIDPTYTKIRLIFYINNKTNRIQPIDIQYDYQTMYYFLTVTQKLRSINPMSQGRQVIEVQLSEKCIDLNSVMDAHFTVGQRKFDLWVPLCFITWTNDRIIQGGEMGFMVVQPDRQFSNYQNTAKILPLTKQIRSTSDQTQAYLFGRSKFGNHEIKLTWWQKQLTIDANVKILDYLAFIMHHFK